MTGDGGQWPEVRDRRAAKIENQKSKIENQKSFRPYTVIFMGTPDFAVPSLKALHESGHRVALVVTQPDRPKGRGRKLALSPVKETALSLGYEVFQPESVRAGEAVERLCAARPDFLAVVAFGQILPVSVLGIAGVAAVNVHASLLPAYRGPAPIQWAIIRGEKETGVTTMMMEKGLDTGDILLTRKVAIGPEDTAGNLHDRLAAAGADLLVETLNTWAQDRIRPVPQDNARASYAPLLKKSDGLLDWRLSAGSLDTFIRGVTPWPGAYTFHMGKRLRILRAKLLARDVSGPPGSVVKGSPREIRIVTGKGALCVTQIQGESGKPLPAEEFLRGNPIPEGTVLG